MKLIKRKLRIAVITVSILLISLVAYGVYSLGVSGNRWFSSSVNTSLRKVKQGVVPGRIYDRNGIQLAGANNKGERLYHTDETTRRSLVHVLGVPDGTVKNGVETFMSYLLYAYDDSYVRRLSAAFSGQMRNGYDLRLSISSGLSRMITDQFPKDKSGAVVVMNYRTGEILSLNSFPNFDPLAMEGVATNPQKPYINNVTQWRSAPGSTFKVVTLAAALANLPDAMERTFTCTGAYQVGESIITDAGNATHGEITLQRALAVSCNITFAKLALELGDEQLRLTAQSFGLDDHLLFSDLVVENSRYPSKDRIAKELAWTGPGQSVLFVTPLHMCLVASAIANDGVMMAPKLLLQALDHHKQGKAQMTPLVYKQVMTAKDADIIAEAMRQVILSGTGTRAAVPGLKICGKTGSAQIDGQESTNAWFVGFIDEKTLPYACCVVVNEAGEGSRHAAPLARQIFEYIKTQR
ncbi:MAG: hypothetical protein GXZ04_02035 [Clostridiales bacterium]|nr:hypothetical protein [Clostridiales bacterium]